MMYTSEVESITVVLKNVCVCVCCRSRMVEEERYLDEKEGIRQRSSDRRAERKAKSDEIKRKYGELSNWV